jgi:hypothetical protein
MMMVVWTEYEVLNHVKGDGVWISEAEEGVLKIWEQRGGGH